MYFWLIPVEDAYPTLEPYVTYCLARLDSGLGLDNGDLQEFVERYERFQRP